MEYMGSDIQTVSAKYIIKIKGHKTPSVPWTSKVNIRYKTTHTMNLHSVTVFADFALR